LLQALDGTDNTTSSDIRSSSEAFNTTHFADGRPRPHHCPSQGQVCPGVLAVTPKQRKHIQLYSRLTTTPEPDVEAMVRIPRAVESLSAHLRCTCSKIHTITE
jgi:hypothetical protein